MTTTVPPAIAQFRTEWETFWTSELGRQLGPEHAPAVRRWAELTIAYRSLLAKCLAEPSTSGSLKQPRANPLWDVMLKTEIAITRLEDRLGLSPRALAEIAETLGEISAMFVDRDPPDPELEVSVPRPSIGEILGFADAGVVSIEAIRAARALHEAKRTPVASPRRRRPKKADAS